MTTWDGVGEGADQGAHQRPHARRSAVGDLQLLRPGGLRAAATSTATATAQEAHRHSVRERRSPAQATRMALEDSSRSLSTRALMRLGRSRVLRGFCARTHARLFTLCSEFALRGSDYLFGTQYLELYDGPREFDNELIHHLRGPYSEYPRACVSTRSTPGPASVLGVLQGLRQYSEYRAYCAFSVASDSRAAGRVVEQCWPVPAAAPPTKGHTAPHSHRTSLDCAALHCTAPHCAPLHWTLHWTALDLDETDGRSAVRCECARTADCTRDCGGTLVQLQGNQRWMGCGHCRHAAVVHQHDRRDPGKSADRRR